VFVKLLKEFISEFVFQSFGSLQRDLQYFLNILLMLDLFKDLLPFLNALFLKLSHPIFAPFRLRMHCFLIHFHFELDTASLAAGTFDGQLIKWLYLPGIFFANIVAVRPYNLPGLVPPPSPLYFFGTGHPQDIISFIVRPNFVFLVFALQSPYF
jgi:hypothetical protein